MIRRKPTINAVLMRHYLDYLKEQERSAATLSKYAHDLAAFCAYLQDEALTKAALSSQPGGNTDGCRGKCIF